jgi:hypothetical protein
LFAMLIFNQNNNKILKFVWQACYRQAQTFKTSNI